MADSLAVSSAHDAKRQEAYKLVNTITLGQLTRKLEQDPTADLSSVLEQQATSYPDFRKSLAQDACEAEAETDPSAELDQDDMVDDAAQITHPLGQEIMAFAGLKGPVTDNELVSTLLSKLHQVMRADHDILFSLYDTCVHSLSATEVVKIGSTSLNPEGITNLQYVNSHLPQVPSPRFLGSLTSEERIYIFMSRGQGSTLEHVWPQLRVADKKSIQEQLNEVFRALRAVAPPEEPPRIGGLASGLCQDMRRMLRTCKGLRSEADFNDFLCGHQDSRRTQTPWIKMIRSFMKDDHRIVLTHGDLHPRNIMVEWQEQDGTHNIKITSILDWEMAGWYPEYWEFTKALATVDARGGPLADWCDYLPTDTIGQWPTEYSMDLLISRWLG